MTSRIVAVCLVVCWMTFGGLHVVAQQSITLTFTGKDAASGVVQTLDSVQVTGLTRSFDTTLIGTQQLILQILTGMGRLDLPVPNGLVLSHAFGNPFTDRTSFYVTTPEAAGITLEVFNVLGKKLIARTTPVEPGVHLFRFEGDMLEPGIYFLTAQAGGSRSTTKMLKTGGGGTEQLQLIYDGPVSGDNRGPGMQKAGAVADGYRFVGFAKGYHPETIVATPLRDTTYEFRLRLANTPPAISSFLVDSYSRRTGDSVRYTLSLTDTDGNLSKAWIDFDGDGRFDDSASVAGGTALKDFSTVFAAPGSYVAKARVADNNGLMDEKPLAAPVVVTQANTPPVIASLTADSYGKLTGDTIRYTVSVQDADGNLVMLWMDFNGDGVFDDSVSVTGGSAVREFKTVFPAPGSYSAKARAKDDKGLTGEKTLSAPVVVTQANTAPTIPSFTAHAYAVTENDSVTYTVSLRDADGNLFRAWIDYDGNGVFDDSASVGGGSADRQFRKAFTMPGSYLAKARVRDAKGLTAEKSLPGPVVVSKAPPVITDVSPDTVIIGGETTMSGKRFGPARGMNVVSFKGGSGGTAFQIAAADYLSWSDTAITLRLPSGILGDGVAYVTVDGRRSNDVPFFLDWAPELTTTAISDIQLTAARSGGNITSDGGLPILARGVCWSTTPNPTTANSQTSDGVGTGSFTSSMTGLSATTTYYVRAYATNSKGTGYGNELSFSTADPSAYVPVLMTVAVTDITTSTARSGGTITSDAGYPVTARGVCWSTTPNPTTANSQTSDGVGTGSFSSIITGLVENTTYYVRAYATNSNGTGYGSELSFTTAQGQVAVLTTAVATSITSTAAMSGGTITSDGGSPVTARGVCWSTSQAPTIGDNITTNGTGIGSFSSTLTGLTASTTYYVRAYATNSAGTGYGNEVSFTTQPGSSVGEVTIGTQVWMQKNLDVATYRNGDPIPQVTDSTAWLNLTTGAWCYYNNDPAMGSVYGKLYNWYAVNDPRGLAPVGWHLPTDAEWDTLTTYLGGQSVAGGKMKEAGTAHWNSPNTGADNSSGFAALPGGARYGNTAGFGNEVRFYGTWWSSSEYDAAGAWSRVLYYHGAHVDRNHYSKRRGCSVRCVRD